MAICQVNGGFTDTYNMGLAYGLDELNSEPIRKSRFIFTIAGVSAWDLPQLGLLSLPPRKAAAPELNFKTQAFEHLVETFYIPVKAEWNPIEVTLFNIKRCGAELRANPTMIWIMSNTPGGFSQTGMYTPYTATWNPHVTARFKRDCDLYIVDGCGVLIEQWRFENAFPERVRFGDYDMDLADVTEISFTLRYDRAFQVGVE